MSEVLTKIVVCAGGEESLGLPPCGHCGEQIEVPMTAEEIAQIEAAGIARAERELLEANAKAELDALKQSAKAKLVAGEPLTSEEAATIVL
jgi:hypothetical protein